MAELLARATKHAIWCRTQLTPQELRAADELREVGRVSWGGLYLVMVFSFLFLARLVLRGCFSLF